MNAKTVCPQHCPGRSLTCHASCPTYLASYEENQRRYAANAEARKIYELSDKSFRESYRRSGRKMPKY